MRPYALVIFLALAGCAQASHVDRPIGMPNPASAACVKQGGTLDIRNGPNGQYGMCHLPDGRMCEEWALFREGRCVADPHPDTQR